jgi:hypothetical protein
MIDRQQQYDKLVNECYKHKQRMMSAIENLQQILPLNGERYQRLTEDEVTHIDQYLFRFAKLQDTMGQRLFRLIMSMLGEDVESMPFIDVLNRLEKMGRIPSVEEWRRLGEIRNQVSHEYDDRPEYMAAALNSVFDARESLFDVLRAVTEANG